MKDTMKIISKQIYNLLGQEVKTIPGINQKEITINRDNLPAGMYFYKIIGNNNESIAVGKMVIQWKTKSEKWKVETSQTFHSSLLVFHCFMTFPFFGNAIKWWKE